MDTTAKLIICVILGAFYAPTISAYEFTDPYPNVKVIDGELHLQRPGGGTTLAYPNAGISKEIPVNTSKGGYLVPVEKTFPVVPAKVGKAATRFARALPVIGTGLAIYDALCDISDICSVDGQWKVKEDTDESRYTSVVGGQWLPGGLAPGGLAQWYSTFQQAFDQTYCGAKGKAAYPNSQHRFHGVRNKDTNDFKIDYEYRESPVFGWNISCTITHRNPYEFGPSSYRAINESDWTAAETKLNAQPEQTATALYNSDAPVPVLASTQSAPVTQQIAQTSTQTKDALGNITGTQTATTTVKVEDTSTTNNITYNITETTTITNYDENNEVTGTQTTTSDSQPPDPPKPPESEDVTMDHGGVPEIPLLTQTIDVQEELDNAEQPSWSGGNCPPDIEIGVYGLEFSLTPFCNFADGLRPIVLMLGAFISFFILSGAKFD